MVPVIRSRWFPLATPTPTHHHFSCFEQIFNAVEKKDSSSALLTGSRRLKIKRSMLVLAVASTMETPGEGGIQPQSSSESSHARTADAPVKKAVAASTRRRPLAALYKTILALLRIVGVVAFWLLLGVSFVRHLYHDYYEPMIHRAGRAANNGELRNDNTYYNRRCTGQDLTATEDTALDILLRNDTSGYDAVDSMMRHGVAVVPNVFSPSTVMDLRAHIVKRNEALSEKETIYVKPNKNRQAFAIDPVEDEAVVKALQEIANHPILQPMVEGLVGRDPAISEIAAITAHSGAKAQNWHNDVTPSGSALKFARTHSHSYSMFVALQESTPEMGPTIVCPGSHYYAGSQAEMCDRHGIQPSTESGVWPAGYGAIFSQQLWHRGDAHVDHESPSRVMFVISFISRPKLGLDNRQLSRGLFCFVKWDIWGHTWQDLLDPYKHMNSFSRVLRASSIWKPAHRNWGLDVLTRSVMEMTLGENGVEPWRLTEIVDAWQEMGFPSFLNGPVTEEEDAWPVYIKTTLNNMWHWLLKVNVALVVVILSFKSLTPNRSQRSISWLLVVAYLVPALLLLRQLNYVKESEWGKSIRSGMAFRSPFPESDKIMLVRDALHPTTQPERHDVLFGTRFDAPFLGAYDRWLDYHPGNKEYNNAIEHVSTFAGSYDGLPVVFEEQVVASVLDSVKPGRLLLQDWQSGDWKVYEKRSKMEPFAEI